MPKAAVSRRRGDLDRRHRRLDFGAQFVVPRLWFHVVLGLHVVITTAMASWPQGEPATVGWAVGRINHAVQLAGDSVSVRREPHDGIRVARLWEDDIETTATP